MSVPHLSILLPVRNEEDYLHAALASLRRQTFTNWELVAVDDGSTDGTSRILEQAAASDQRIKVIRTPPLGLVAALNTGLAECRAPLVARMDGDDLCHPHRLERQVAWLDSHPADSVVTCRVRLFPSPAITAGMRAYETWQNSLLSHEEICRDLFVESPLAHPSVVYRREAVVALGGYRDQPWAEDYDLWLRLAAAGARFSRLPELLFFWRDHPRRHTRTAGISSLAAFRACKVHHLKHGYLKGERRVTLWGAGSEGKAWRAALAAAEIEVQRWIEVDRRKIGQVIHGAPVTAIDTLLPGDDPLLITIGTRGAREDARKSAAGRGLIEGRDYVCVT